MPVESESPRFPQTPAQGLLSLSECMSQGRAWQSHPSFSCRFLNVVDLTSLKHAASHFLLPAGTARR